MSVYVWGSNKSHQLIGQSGLHSYAPALVADQFDGQIPVQVATGDGHTLVLFESGDIYSFGRGKEGQLGREVSDSERKSGIPTLSKAVIGLEHESIIGIAAGALTSYAISSSGEVYQWGLVHQHVNENATNISAVRAGELTGLAQDQTTTVVNVDSEARAASNKSSNSTQSNNNNSSNSNTNGVSTGRSTRNGRAQPESRQLRDIVRDSTEQWMMPSEDAENEYYEELRAMGYQNEDVEQRMQDRGREYHGMLAMGCKRAIQSVPRLVPNLDNIRIVAISAGYAHVMLLSDKGQLYGAGYNDRGQLGLGHRINTSDFKHVDVLGNKFVVQVVCGQQHTLCRAVDIPSSTNGIDPDTVFVGSEIGADAYVWGNGVLGQLGIGTIGTSRGCLRPKLLLTMADLYPQGVVCVAAGANFSAVVTIDGSVYSFGHAEYNQHGTGNQSYRDYTDPYYYFTPRVIECFDNRRPPDDVKTQEAAAKKRNLLAALSSSGRTRVGGGDRKIQMRYVVCGAVFTVGVDKAGNLHSWGWNESGVLGHGFNHFSSSPSEITTIGKGFDGCKVLSIVAGAKHIVALTQAQGNPWALTFKSILETAPYADCMLHVTGGYGNNAVSFPCHRAILSCRSKYFAGFVRAAENEVAQERLFSQLSLSTSSGTATVMSNEIDPLLHLTVVSPYANASTIKSLLEYLYLDRIHIPFHRRKELLNLAHDLNITVLITALEGEAAEANSDANDASNKKHKNKSENEDEWDVGGRSSAVAISSVGLVNETTHKFKTPDSSTVSALANSYFLHDLSTLFKTSQQQGGRAMLSQSAVPGVSLGHCDIIFVDYMGPTACHSSCDDEEMKSVEFHLSEGSFVLYAHKVIISRIAYFEAIIAGHFSESSNYVNIRDAASGELRRVLCVDVSGLQADGIDLETFYAVVLYAYTGRFTLPADDKLLLTEEDCEDSADMALVMSCLVAANRLGFALLTQHCERVLSLHIGEYYPHNAENALSFAVNYNIPRLERQCLKVLKRSHEIAVSASPAGTTVPAVGEASSSSSSTA